MAAGHTLYSNRCFHFTILSGSVALVGSVEPLIAGMWLINSLVSHCCLFD